MRNNPITPEAKGHDNGESRSKDETVLCFGPLFVSSDGITKCCPKCGAFFNPGEEEPFGYNLDAAQDHLGA